MPTTRPRTTSSTRCWPPRPSTRTSPATVTGDNRGRYSNPKFDELLAKARATEDGAARTEIYKEAEKIAMDDVALIPLWNRHQLRLANTKKFANLQMDFHEDPNLAQISLK